jgi:hypothetical protein
VKAAERIEVPPRRLAVTDDHENDVGELRELGHVRHRERGRSVDDDIVGALGDVPHERRKPVPVR